MSRCTPGKGDPCSDSALWLEGGVEAVPERGVVGRGLAIITEGTSDLETMTPSPITNRAETRPLWMGGRGYS